MYFSPTFFHHFFTTKFLPTGFSPVYIYFFFHHIFHPLTFRPDTFHPQIFTPQIFHPIYFSPTDFSPHVSVNVYLACSTQLRLVSRPLSAASLHPKPEHVAVASPSQVPNTKNPTKMINGSSCQRSIPRRQKCSSIFNAKPSAAHQHLTFSMAPSLQAFTGKPTNFTQIRQKCCSIVNAKAARADQPLRFSMAPSPQAFTAKPTSFPNPAEML